MYVVSLLSMLDAKCWSLTCSLIDLATIIQSLFLFPLSSFLFPLSFNNMTL
jgi:hypothetical protein